MYVNDRDVRNETRIFIALHLISVSIAQKYVISYGIGLVGVCRLSSDSDLGLTSSDETDIHSRDKHKTNNGPVTLSKHSALIIHSNLNHSLNEKYKQRKIKL